MSLHSNPTSFSHHLLSPELNDFESDDLDFSISSKSIITNSNDRSIQTDPFVTRSIEIQAIIQVNSEEIYKELNDSEDKNVDYNKVNKFILKSINTITSELKKSKSSHAFDDFNKEDINNDISTISTLHTLTSSYLSSVSCVSFNSTGNTIAIGYSNAHNGFCEHRSGFVVYNLVRRTFLPNLPESTFELSSCITSIVFHPVSPSIVAVGLYTGEIRVYDISGVIGEEIIMHSDVEEHCHKEPVMQMKWWESYLKGEYYLISIAGDGKLIFWTMTPLMIPFYGTRIASKLKSSAYSYMGGNSFALSPTILIGTECGNILKASLPQNKRKEGEIWTNEAWKLVQDAPNRSEVKREVEKYAKLAGISSILPATVFSSVNPSAYFPSTTNSSFLPHSSWISSISYSPLIRSLFLSASGDGTLRVSSLFQNKPLIDIKRPCIIDACWSPTRSAVLAFITQRKIEFFDWGFSRAQPVLSESLSKNNLTCLEWNKKDPSLLAVGDVDGKVRILKVSSNLASAQSNEKRIMEEIINAREEQEEMEYDITSEFSNNLKF